MSNVYPTNSALSITDRQALLSQNPLVIWMTGLSGAGKTTLATLLEQQLHVRGFKTVLLDGDSLRSGLNKDLGFSVADRSENIRRTAEVARIAKDAGLVVLVSLISPTRADRSHARSIVGPGFVEVFVDCPLEKCIQRDVKGLYAKATSGQIQEFTGISAEYERPEYPEVTIKTQNESVTESLNRLMNFILPLVTVSSQQHD